MIEARSSPRRRLLEAGTAAVVYVILLFLAHGFPVTRSRVLLPADLAFVHTEPWVKERPSDLRRAGNPLLSDAVFQFLPWEQHLERELADGSFPLWNPYSFTGEPFLGNLQSSTLYPLQIPTVCAFGAKAAVGLIGFLCALFGGLTMYLFLRRRRLSFAPALLGGSVFLLCGVMTAWFFYLNTRVACFFPLLLLLSDRLVQRRDLASAAWLALVVALQFLGGHIETSFFVLFGTGVYFIARWARASARGWRTVLIPFGIALGILLFGIAIGAAQLFPFLEALFKSDTWAVRSAESTSHMYLPSKILLTLLVPDAFGNPSRGAYWAPGGNWCENAGYVGILPLLLALIGAGLAWRRRTNWIWVVLACFSLGMTYGMPVLFDVVARLPGFSVSVGSRLLVVFDVALAVLAAEGLSILLDRRRESRFVSILAALSLVAAAIVTLLVVDQAIASHRDSIAKSFFESGAFAICRRSIARYVVATVLGAGLLWLAWRLPARAIGAAACLLVALDLVSYSHGYLPTIRKKRVLPETASLRWLRENSREPGTDSPVRIRPIANVLPPNLAMSFELNDVRGYDPMAPKLCADLDRAGRLSDDQALAAAGYCSPILNLVGARYIVAPWPITPLPPDSPLELVHSADLWVYRNARALPRAFTASSYRVVSDDEALARIAAPDFNPRCEVLLASDPPGLTASTGRDSTTDSGAATVTSYAPEEVRIAVSLQRPGFVVLTDTWFPGWSVSVDSGAWTTPLRANHTFRAVALDSGEHSVVFRFRPLSFVVGCWTTLASLIGAIVAMVFFRRRRHAFKPAAGSALNAKQAERERVEADLEADAEARHADDVAAL